MFGHAVKRFGLEGSKGSVVLSEGKKYTSRSYLLSLWAVAMTGWLRAGGDGRTSQAAQCRFERLRNPAKRLILSKMTPEV